jgi:hypothetical protein
VFKTKFKNGKVDQLMAVNTAQGHKDSDTFTPVVKITTFRLSVAKMCNFKMQIHQLDVQTAFIYAPLEEEVYVMPHK